MTTGVGATRISVAGIATGIGVTGTATGSRATACIAGFVLTVVVVATFATGHGSGAHAIAITTRWEEGIHWELDFLEQITRVFITATNARASGTVFLRQAVVITWNE